MGGLCCASTKYKQGTSNTHHTGHPMSLQADLNALKQISKHAPNPIMAESH